MTDCCWLMCTACINCGLVRAAYAGVGALQSEAGTTTHTASGPNWANQILLLSEQVQCHVLGIMDTLVE
jgi:hypothetical protein